MTVGVIKQSLKEYKSICILVRLIRKLLHISFDFCTFLKTYLNNVLISGRRLRMAFLYRDHMILQCEERLSVKGEARPGEWVTVSIGGNREKTCCQSDGHWEVDMPPLSAGGPYLLEICSSKEKLVYRDVYAGEVWLCSGQSNMAVTMGGHLRNSKLDENDFLSNRKSNPFRYFSMESIWPSYPVVWNWIAKYCINHYQGLRLKGWNDCTPEKINSLSAIAFFYGTYLSRQLEKPVGLIVNPVGGTAEYCWIERRLMQKEYPEILSDWYNNQKVTIWMKNRAIQNLGKRAVAYENLHPYYPGYCFEAFIRPVKDYAIKGCIWFSGESSAQLNDTGQFEKLQEMQIRNWRESFGKNFPFYYVQLHGMNYEQTFGEGLHYFYPEIRNSQRRLLSQIPDVGMAVSYDLSVMDNVHFRNRKPAGERLARLALHKTYGKGEIMPCGPLYHEALLRDNFIYIKFDWAEGLCTKDGDKPKTFEVAGKDKCFHPAKASIAGEEIILSCREVSEPVWVHYAFDEYPIDANLVNGEGVPAACFEERICKSVKSSSIESFPDIIE